MEREVTTFLSALSCPKTVRSALPSDVVAFLVWKDQGGRTVVHLPACTFSTDLTRRVPSCSCPKRLAFGTVDSLIGKLRAIFIADGRGTVWCSALGLGNPAVAKVVKDYLADVRGEQLKARVVPRQAEPVLVADLQVISGFIQSRLLSGKIFVLARDKAFL